MKKYLPRVADKILEKKLRLYGAILIEGCKWCGKSTTARNYSKSFLELQDLDNFENNMEIAYTKPSLLLKGEKPRLIDEWQDAPMIWDAIRYDVDKSGLKGEYILTGSATPKDYKPKHSGTGRIIRILMRPMSLYESKDSTGEVSLEQLFNGEKNIEGVSSIKLEDTAFLCARGGWPEGINFKGEDAYTISRDYLESVINSDLKLADGVERNPERIRKVLRSLARNISQTVSISVIKEDIATDSLEINEKTIESYIEALKKIYIVEDIEAWSPKLRSKTDIRTSKKRGLVDPSLALAALRATDQDLLKDFKTFGFVFEALVLRDLKIYADYLDGDIFYYRDKTGLECDAILHLRNGKWGAIEIKIGSTIGIEEAAKNLLKLRNKINTDSMNEPSFLAIITAAGYAYRREDGIFIIPIGCLKY